jgi:hypothetical protein
MNLNWQKTECHCTNTSLCLCTGCSLVHVYVCRQTLQIQVTTRYMALSGFYYTNTGIAESNSGFRTDIFMIRPSVIMLIYVVYLDILQ